MFCKKGFLKTFAKFTGKHRLQNQDCNFIKKETGQEFSYKFCGITSTVAASKYYGKIPIKLPVLNMNTEKECYKVAK